MEAFFMLLWSDPEYIVKFLKKSRLESIYATL